LLYGPEKNGDSLKEISVGGRIILDKDESGGLHLSYSNENEVTAARERLLNLPIRLFVVGDFKFCAQLLGCNNMSGSRYMCVEWPQVKEPSEICGVVQFSVWDFIEVDQVVYPVLHSEIGLVNDALDSFYDFIDDNIEVLTDYEKVA
jgi:hypothetical protein